MAQATYNSELEAVIDECLSLLTVFLAYRELKISRNWSTGTKLDLMLWWAQLHAIENDIVIRLCRLDEKDNSKHSLWQALACVRNKLSDNEAKKIQKSLKSYRDLINPIKTKGRNFTIAHLSKKATLQHDPDQWSLEGPISKVVNIIDSLAQQQIYYRLNLGSHGHPVDLRLKLSIASEQ